MPRSTINTAVDIWFGWHPKPQLCSDHKPEWTAYIIECCWCWYCGSSHRNPENSATHNRKTGSCEMDQSIFLYAFFLGPGPLCPLWTETFLAQEEHRFWDDTRAFAMMQGCLSVVCFIPCHTSHFSYLGRNVRRSVTVHVKYGLSGAHVEAGCFHQPHTETFSSGQGFTIIWMFSGFPVSPEEILQHPVFLPTTFGLRAKHLLRRFISLCHALKWKEYILDLKCYWMRLVLLGID